MAKALVGEDVEVFIVRLPRFGYRTPEILQNVVAKIPVDKVDLIHVQEEYGLYQRLESSFFEPLKSFDKPIITTMHAVGNWDLDTIIAHYSDRIIVHNEFCAKRLAHSSVIIPHGSVPRNLASPEKAKKSIGIPPEAKIVGYCGFISNYKGLEELIDAMTKVPHVGLVIAGGWHTAEDTRYIEQLKQVTQEKLPRRCQWLGYILDEDLARVYASMDLVVYPSRFATESGALIMALNHGKAVIASNIAPFKEKEKQGVIMTFKNVSDLTQKIKKLLKNDELRHHYEQKALEYTEQTSWTNIAKLHKSLYEDVLARKD